jgi:hypothetical protein
MILKDSQRPGNRVDANITIISFLREVQARKKRREEEISDAENEYESPLFFN